MNSANLKNMILAGCAAVGTFITHYLGGWDLVFHTLFAFILADYLSGCMVALVWRRSNKTEGGGYDSRAGFKGLCRKACIFLAVAVAHHLDEALGFDYIRTGVCLFFIGNEGLSFVENLGIMGVPFPPFVKQALEVLREKAGEAQLPGSDDKKNGPSAE